MRLLLISSSVVHGYGYLDHSEEEIRRILEGRRTVSFVPFAQHDDEAYTARVRERLAAMGFGVAQVRERADVEAAEAIFIGGGNTFRLLKTLYDRELLDPIRARVRGGMPYIGSSAGTNVATVTIKTTNDMPIVYPPSFDALGFVSFQINPHYLDPDPNSTHKGETREDRIREFHEENETPVVGLREGSMLSVEDGIITLLGSKPARIFRRGHEPEELPPN
ncbi:MAG TPA: dipeptidase PepE, partial [Thermoanaerobaculia bacterium]|nr:dipeptidase PepE [Thermoanaerobaculia bacterium]